MPRLKKETTETKIKKESVKTKSFYQGIGRRKTATASVRLYVVADSELQFGDKIYKPGDFIVNNMPATEYFKCVSNSSLYLEPLRITNNLTRFVTIAKVSGSGQNSQLDAVVLGVSRALLGLDSEKNRPILRKKGFLTRDPRARERRKVGFMGARTRKSSPKR